MTRNAISTLPEVFGSTTALSAVVSRGVRRGDLRQIGSRLYTRNLADAPERIVRRHLWPLVASYAPGALIADRTAMENAPAGDGSVFVVSDRKRDIVLPGLTVRPRKGPGPLDNDRPFIGGLRLSSTARAYLDNMARSRRRSGEVSRTLGRDEIELRLDDLIRRNGAESANRLRDEARRIAPLLGREAEFAELELLIGALLGTRQEPLLTSRARARHAGAPYDPDRLELFELLRGELRATSPPDRAARPRDGEGRATLAFFEAYFSNFIEGTEFDVSEAADIVFRKQQGLRLEDSQLETADRLVKLTAIAVRAASIIMQLVQARDGKSDQMAEVAFTAAEIETLQALVPRLEGKTALQKNPHPPGCLAWAGWAIAKLGGWDGYPNSKPPGPITFRHGLQYFRSVAQGWTLRAVTQDV